MRKACSLIFQFSREASFMHWLLKSMQNQIQKRCTVHTTRCCRNSDATLEGFKKPSHDTSVLPPNSPPDTKNSKRQGALWSKKRVGAEMDNLANFSSFFTKYSIMGNEYSKIHCMVLKNWWSISALWGPLTEGVPSASSYSSKTSWLGFWNPSHWIIKSA